MTRQELANARALTEYYVLTEPDGDPVPAIRHEAWLEKQDLGWLQVFEDAVHCLDMVLQRVLEKRYGHAADPV